MNTELLSKIALEVILPVIIMTAVGLVLGWRRILDPEPTARLYLYTFAPALAFVNVLEANFSGDDFRQILMFCGLSLVVLLGITQGLGRILKYDRGKRGAFSNSVILYNSANYGLPVMQQAFGTLGGLIQALVLTLQSLTSFTLGSYLAATNSPSLWATTKRIFAVPLIWALLLAVALRYCGLTLGHVMSVPTIWLPLAAFKLALVPAALLSLGVQLSRVSIHGKVRDIFLGTTMRLIIGPLVGLGVGLLLKIPGPLLGPLVVSISFPSAVMSSVLATDFANHEDYAAATVFVSTVASLVTVTATIYLAQTTLMHIHW
jgi:malate permease and related proteins